MIHVFLSQDIGTLFTIDKHGRELKDAAIYIEGNSISWVGPAVDLPGEYQNASRVISLADHVVMPGLVNTHHHTFQNLTRCVAQVETGHWNLALS